MMAFVTIIAKYVAIFIFFLSKGYILDNSKTICLEEVKFFDDLKVGDSLHLSLDGGETKEYKIIKVSLNKPIETDPVLPIEISYSDRDRIIFSYDFDGRLFSKNKKVNNKPFYSRFSKHYSHK